MIDLSIRYSTGHVLSIGTEVAIKNSSPASTNLYEKALIRGMSFVHCPCASKSTDVYTIVKQFENGFMLKHKVNGRVTVAVASDLRSV